ncbi:VanZ family protein [Thermodesulfobacteriota bacterium]
MKNLRYPKFWLALGCLWVGLVIFLSLVPAPTQPVDIPGLDKVGHIFAYWFLMFWFGLIYNPGRAYRRLGLGFVIMGIILECIQGALGDRTFEWGDIAANALGVIVGLVLSGTILSEVLVRVEGKLVRNRNMQ